MSYQVEILRRAQKQLAGLPGQDFKKITRAVHALAEDPRPSGCKKLTGREGWRIRVGDYRIIYDIADTIRIVTILDVGHRRHIYR